MPMLRRNWLRWLINWTIDFFKSLDSLSHPTNSDLTHDERRPYTNSIIHYIFLANYDLVVLYLHDPSFSLCFQYVLFSRFFSMMHIMDLAMGKIRYPQKVPKLDSTQSAATRRSRALIFALMFSTCFLVQPTRLLMFGVREIAVKFLGCLMLQDVGVAPSINLAVLGKFWQKYVP